MRWTIRAKLTALVLAVLVPLVAGAGLEFWRDLRSERARTQAEMLEFAQYLARHFDEVLSGQIENLEALGNVRRLSRIEDADLTAVATRIRAHHPFLHRLVAIAPDGVVIAASGGSDAGGRAFADRALVEVALQDRQSRVGAPQPSAADGRLVIPLVVPVTDSGGSLLGVTAAELDLRQLSAFLDGLRLPPGTSAAIVTRDGTVVAQSGGAVKSLGRPFATAPAARALIARQSGIAEWRWDDGIDSLAGAAPVSLAPWIVVTAVPSAVAYAPAGAELWGNLLGLGLATLVAVFVAWLISRRMNRSVQSLMAGARGLAAGEGPPIVVPTRDELAELAEQFNRAMDARRQAQADIEARQRRLRALADISLSLSQQLDLERLLQQVTDSLARLTGAFVVVLWEIQAATGRIVRRAVTADPSIPSVELPTELALDEGGTGWIARHREPLFLADITEDPRIMAVDWALRNDLVVFAGVPVSAGDELLGVLTLNLKRGTLPREGDRALLVSFASQAAVAIHNARLFAETEARRREAETLGELGHALAQALDPDIVAQWIADHVRALLRARSAGLYRLEADGSLVAAAVSGDMGPAAGRGLVFPRGIGIASLVVRERAPVVSSNLLADSRIILTPDVRARIEQAGYRSVLSLPLLVRDTVIGALSVGDVEGRVFSEDETRLALAFADQAALAFQNARLYDEANRRRREAEELARVARALTETLDITTVAERIVEAVNPLFAARSAVIRLRQPDGSLVALASSGSAREQLPPGHTLPPGVGLSARAVAEGRALWSADVTAEPGVSVTEDLRSRNELSGLGAVLVVPLRTTEETIGMLAVADQAGRVFSQSEADLLQAFADQAALALDNARLYGETRQRLRHVDSLREVVEQILVPFSLEERLNLIARKAAELFDGDRATVALLDETTGKLVVRAGYQLSQGEIGRVLSLEHGAMGVAVSQRRGVLVNDYAAWPHRDPYIVAAYTADPAQATIGCPLLIRGQAIGALSVGLHRAGRRFTAADLDQLTSLAAPAALAIEHGRLYAELEQRLRELQETQAQLLQAGKLSVVGQLVSGVAHELNNPLSVVIGYGQLMLGKELPPEIRRPLELIVAQGDRMAKIVQSLLLFSRQRAPERRALGLRDVLEQTVGLRATQLTLSGIRVETDYADALPETEGDAHQLQQVFLNLLLNAEQAILGSGTGERRVGDHIRVSTSAHREGDAIWVRAEVADNGPGIAADVLPRIFEPFFTTKRVGEGTGLGLSVSYGIVQQHGGRLRAASEPGRTVFRVDLPALAGSAAPTVGAAVPEPAAAGHGRHALVVDDEPDIVDIVTTLLRQRGWQVDVAPGGRSALERLRAGRRYDLVVSDIRMPDGSGEEFYRTATSQRQELAGRFVFITGDTANAEAWRFLEATRAPVIEKPFTPEALLRAVERVAT
jgi:GAF domain-containing protein